MPIVLVHGVGVREPNFWPDVDQFLKKYISPVISKSPSEVRILRAYWGDYGGKLAWEGSSRPRTPLFGMGAGEQANGPGAALVAEQREVVQGLPGRDAAAPARTSLLSAGTRATGSPGAGSARLKDFTPRQLSDLLGAIFQELGLPNAERLALTLAADDVVNDEATSVQLRQCADLNAEVRLLQDLVKARRAAAPQPAGLQAMGDNWLSRFGERVREAVDRGADAPGFVLSRVIGEARGPLNSMATDFVRDVFQYLSSRGTPDSPGDIPQCVIDRLLEAVAIQKTRPGEPIVVITHSMGGQIVYDLLTSFLPKLQDSGIRIDFWCATASQVGLFEELKLFLSKDDQYSKSTGKMVPRLPQTLLGCWWNVWDYNDFLSFTGKEIFEGVDDSSYNSGMSLITAHGGYLTRAGFFRELAGRLESAAEAGWK